MKQTINGWSGCILCSAPDLNTMHTGGASPTTKAPRNAKCLKNLLKSFLEKGSLDDNLTQSLNARDVLALPSCILPTPFLFCFVTFLTKSAIIFIIFYDEALRFYFAITRIRCTINFIGQIVDFIVFNCNV
jgi:hypothetical protein